MSIDKQQPLVGVAHRPGLRPLTEEQVRFEIDMCIGCDRCMRACPIPLSSQVHITDLNHATISDNIAPHVARFTEECVMCGSCVPVCPVHNHRDLLMLSLKQRLGVSWDGNVDLNRILNFLPPGWNASLLVSRLREQPMFSDARLVPENYLLHLTVSSKLLTLMPGEVLMHEGEYGRSLYLILEGRIDLSAAGATGEELPIAVLRRGEYLGERGLLTGQQRNATARAQTASVILEVPEQVMQRLMELVPAIRAFFEQLNNARSLESILRRMALFQGIAAADIRYLAEQAQVKRYDREELLFQEQSELKAGSASELMHIILEGFVKVARRTKAGTGRDKSDERIIAYRQSGDYFAVGLDLLGDGRPVSVTAITRVGVAEIPRAALHTVLARNPAANQRFTAQLQQYRDAAVAAQTSMLDPLTSHGASIENKPLAADADVRASLQSLIGGGVIEGTEVLVIDLDKCVHCNECEEACARRHGHSRMNRKGMVVGNMSIATACRQCQDPVCLLCSRAGIARLPSGEVYITESCIGCGICAERCPYDNISIMTLEEESVAARTMWQSFSNFFMKGTGKERGRRLLPVAQAPLAPGPFDSTPPDAYGEMRKKVAIKCDLCVGYNNQACVQACPVSAVVRVQPVEFFGSTEDILRLRAL